MAEMGERGVAIFETGSGGDASRRMERNDLSGIVPLSYLTDDGDGGLVLMLTWVDGSCERRPLNRSQIIDWNEKIARWLKRRG